MTKLIVEFYWDCGRQGKVTGTFVCDKTKLDAAYGSEVYFGEILGKHSEVYGTLDEEDITVKSDDQNFIKQFEGIMGEDWYSGCNPLFYIEESEEG